MHTLWTPIIEAHWPNKILMEFPKKAYFNILIWFTLWIPNCVKKCNPSQSCSKILTKFDLGQYLFLRVQVSSREHYYVGSTWRLHGNCVLGGDSIFFKLLTLCITHFDQSSYGGEQMKKLPSQSEKVDIVKTLLFTYLISPFLIMCHWQDLILSHTQKEKGWSATSLWLFLLHANCLVQIWVWDPSLWIGIPH